MRAGERWPFSPPSEIAATGAEQFKQPKERLMAVRREA
jgi:hypothetical protein